MHRKTVHSKGQILTGTVVKLTCTVESMEFHCLAVKQFKEYKTLYDCNLEEWFSTGVGYNLRKLPSAVRVSVFNGTILYEFFWVICSIIIIHGSIAKLLNVCVKL